MYGLFQSTTLLSFVLVLFRYRKSAATKRNVNRAKKKKLGKKEKERFLKINIHKASMHVKCPQTGYVRMLPSRQPVKRMDDNRCKRVIGSYTRSGFGMCVIFVCSFCCFLIIPSPQRIIFTTIATATYEVISYKDDIQACATVHTSISFDILYFTICRFV